jgi:ATP-dependent DNA helicase RecG
MPIEKTTITVEQRDRILASEEGHFMDLKAAAIAPAKLTEAISAFANSDGGELFVGIGEDKTTGRRNWSGFANQEAANGHLQIFEHLFPLGADFEYTFLECEKEQGLVLQVVIQKTRDIKRASDGHPYIRRGAQKLRVSDHASLKQLEYTKGLTSFESEVLPIAPENITNSVPVIEFMLNVIPMAEPSTWLAKQQLLRDDKPTVAGVLLFAEEPQAILPKRCGIKVYRYATKGEGTRETLAFDPTTIEGYLYDQIRQAVVITTQTVEQVKKLGDETLETVAYPSEAIHEIITNAVLHRDYSIADDIHIRIFDNRIEVESPGRLPAHITIKNILYERFARNGNIVRLINKYPDPPNKDVGEGLNTAFAAMTKLGLKVPVISERGNSVLVSIRHEPLASPEQVILEYLESNVTIRNKQAREICHITADYIVKEIFNRLVERGLIEKVPGTRTGSTAYKQGRKFANWRGEIQPASPSDPA